MVYTESVLVIRLRRVGDSPGGEARGGEPPVEEGVPTQPPLVVPPSETREEVTVF